MRGYEFSKSLKKEIRKSQEGRCDRCGKFASLQVHHIWPLAWGGSGRRKNGVGLCESCHKIVDEQTFNTGRVYDD